MPPGLPTVELSPKEILASLPVEVQQSYLSGMTDQQIADLFASWEFHARPKQLPPPGDWRIWLLLAGRGFGKELCIHTKVPTPTGWTTMGEIGVGDRVLDENGNPCTVTWVSPVDVPEVAYRLTFSDGSTLDACSEHQWVTWTHAERKAYLRSPYEDTSQFPDDWVQWRLKRMHGHQLPEEVVNQAIALHQSGLSVRAIEANIGANRASLSKHLKAGQYTPREPKVYGDSPHPQVRTTQQIVDTLTIGVRGDTNHCIPQCRPLQLPRVDLPVPPYTLGLWLSDGSKGDACISKHQDDLPFLREQIEADGFQTTTRSDEQQFGILGFRRLLIDSGLFGNKRVPSIYLRASFDQRLAFLQGLLDGDGYVGENGYCEFSNTNIDIANAVYELLVGMGIKVSRTTKTPTLNGVEYTDVTLLSFMPTFPVFRLPRKRDRLIFDKSQSLRRYHRMIVKAERIESTPMRCITVDSPNSMYLAGEAMIPTHNTKTIVQWALIQAKTMPGSRGALVATTASDARDVLVDGESGFLQECPEDFRPVYQPTKRRLTFPNGSRATLYSADEPRNLRGPQHHWAICDEISSWQYPEALDMLLFGLRLGDNPRVAIATTPRPIPLIKRLVTDKTCYVTHGTTYENRANLPSVFYEGIIKRYEGSRLGRQELLGEILPDELGGLWSKESINASRVTPDAVPDLVKVVVGIDPAVTANEGSNETGIIVAGKSANGHAYVLADYSLKAVPSDWAVTALDAYRYHRADHITAEVNNGGDLVTDVIRVRDNNVKVVAVRASRGKVARAEPVAMLYDQNRIHHVGVTQKNDIGEDYDPKFEELEKQMIDLVQGKEGNDRCDSLVWALWDLLLAEEEEAMTPIRVGNATFRHGLSWGRR